MSLSNNQFAQKYIAHKSVYNKDIMSLIHSEIDRLVDKLFNSKLTKKEQIYLNKIAYKAKLVKNNQQIIKSVIKTSLNKNSGNFIISIILL